MPSVATMSAHFADFCSAWVLLFLPKDKQHIQGSLFPVYLVFFSQETISHAISI